ncbi:MAG TPA: sialidase family protein, partial [Candidatus Thermoplasmatota archaeon]
ANGDNDVAVDLAGNVYASDLGGGIQSFASYDAGETWTYTGNVVEINPETNTRYSSDRNWMAAGRNGHMILAWMGGGPNVTRSVSINTTFDGGQTWLGAQYVSRGMGWLGSVQFHPDLVRAYIPFTVPQGPAAPGEGRTFDLRIAFTPDGGYTWEERSTNTTIRASSNGGHFSGMMMAPALDVTQDGHVIYAWSEEVLDPVNLNAVGSRVRYIASGDDGLTWTQPFTLSTTENAIMPWVAGGGGDRFAVAYYATDMAGDTDHVPWQWFVEAVVVDAALAPAKLVYTVVDPDVHLGNICARGTGCSTPPLVSDRGFLDFFEIDLLPDGHLVIAYTADQVDQASSQEIRFALQTGGTPLFLVE